jgi:hypothetical protein
LPCFARYYFFLSNVFILFRPLFLNLFLCWTHRNFILGKINNIVSKNGLRAGGKHVFLRLQISMVSSKNIIFLFICNWRSDRNPKFCNLKSKNKF